MTTTRIKSPVPEQALRHRALAVNASPWFVMRLGYRVVHG
jgi:hypothetical protein